MIRHLSLPANEVVPFLFDRMYGSVAVLHEDGDDPVYCRGDGGPVAIRGNDCRAILPGDRRIVLLRDTTTPDGNPVIKLVSASNAVVEIEVETD